MKPVHVCIPVLNRYDLLERLLSSLQTSLVRPAGIYIINNGTSALALQKAVGKVDSVPVTVHTPRHPLGVAESWNWFLMNVEEERVITNDDIVFYPETLEALVGAPGDFIYAQHGYSCFVIRDRCIEHVGFFDDTISPGYAYYEDVDYAKRMELTGVIAPTVINVRMDHAKSQTLEAFTDDQRAEHNAKFALAQENYIRKWGCLPGERIQGGMA